MFVRRGRGQRRAPTLAAAIAALLLAALAAGPGSAQAAPSAAPPALAPPAAVTGTIEVGIKPLDPFVVRNGDRYQGFSIDLWDEVARRNGWDTTYVWHETLPPLLDAAAGGTVDVAIAGISITREREARFDFSYPMFNAGLQILTGDQRQPSWTDQLGGLFSASVARYLLVVVVAIVVAGHVIWLLGRRHRRRAAAGGDTPGDGTAGGATAEHGYVRGVGHASFQAAAVALTGDLGAAGARKPLGRLFAVLWVVAGIVFVSLFTATITTRLTVASIKSDIAGVADLPGKRVVTVGNTTAASFLTARRVPFTTAPTIDDAYLELEAGRADAVVFDAPVLQHHVQVAGSRRLTLVGGVFQREDYGIGMPTGSALRKPINEALLAMRADGTYDAIYERYFGSSAR